MSHLQAKKSAASHSLLDLYLNEIRHYTLLSGVEEKTLAHAISRGDQDAQDEMVLGNLRLVVRIAQDFRGRGLAIDDLIGEGNVGLIRASVQFNPDFGTRFSTYAGYWIKQAIRHALTNTTATIRLPSHMMLLLTKWRRGERVLTRELGQAPTEDQISVQLGLTQTQLEMVRSARRASRLQQESCFADDDNSWSSDEAMGTGGSPDAHLEACDEMELLLHQLDRLDERERLVISLRFGLNDQTPQTLKEVGNRLGVTREWVRKIELRAIGKLEESGPSAPVMTRKSPRPGSRLRTRSAAPSLEPTGSARTLAGIDRNLRVINLSTRSKAGSSTSGPVSYDKD